MKKDAETSDLIGQRKLRIEKVESLKKLGIDPYPSKSERNIYSKNIKDNFAKLENKEVIVAGRLMSIREHGALVFYDVQDTEGRIQIYIKKDELSDTSVEKQILGFDNLDLLDVGDIIEVKGLVTKTQRGELSIFAKEVKILTKAIRPLPTEIKDKELIFRKRYLDTTLNPENKYRFQKYAEIIFAIREFLTSKGFLEIKTPIIQPIYGGGLAKPFMTHVNALDVDYYMAVSHELYLKRLITAGFDNVFNLVGYFRNEGIDRTHNPEFTMVETMSAFKDYEYNMDITEEMYRYITTKVFKKSVFNINGKEVDFSKPWERIMMIDAVKKHTGYDWNSVKTIEEAHKILAKEGVDKRPNSLGESMVELFKDKVERLLIHPTIVYGHPVEISPLAKAMHKDKRFVERFEGFIGGIETGDNWSELNDPQELFNRFKDQIDRKKGGDEEAHPMDTDFVEMMEYGMPPTTGLGPGIERLTMMLTETEYIDDVIFFPMLRPKQVTKQEIEIYGEEYVLANSTQQQAKKEAKDRVNSRQSASIAEQDFSNRIVVVVNSELPNWQLVNAVAHTSAYIGHKLEEKFDTGEHFVTKDGIDHPRNTQYPIVVLAAKPGQMANFMQKVRESGLLYHGFIREMIETSNDSEITEILSKKKDDEIEYLGVGVFGEGEVLKKLTNKFSLLK